MISDTGNWVSVCPLERLASQPIVRLRLGEVDFLLVRRGAEILACERACPHEQADLGLGRVADGRLFCPRHLASFDLQDGTVSAGWPSRRLRMCAARVSDQQVWIDAAIIATWR